MKKITLCLSGFSLTALLLSGCGQSKPDSATAEQKPTPPAAPATAATPAPPSAPSPASTPAAPAPAADTASATAATTPVAQPSAPATPNAGSTIPAPATAAPASAPDSTTPDASPITDAASQLVTTAKAQGDSTLSSVGNDLATKAKTLVQSAAGNATLKSQLASSLKSFAGGNDSGGLSTIYQAAQSASLTPPQMQLAKEVGNLASAYVVQKNFASLEGAQGDVATIVNSLRQGQITPAIPALQKVAQNANLTAAQKQLMASIADKYAPGISKAAGALSQGLQSLPGLGGK